MRVNSSELAIRCKDTTAYPIEQEESVMLAILSLGIIIIFLCCCYSCAK